MTMASTADSSFKLNITTCSNCFETLRNPKYFPCLHSFCEECMKAYITMTYIKTKGGIHCPVCRIYVQKPDGISVEEWSANLPTNHLLVSLIDWNESKSSKKLCKACARENETESACSWCINCSESLCKSCKRYHGRNKFTSNHKVIDIESCNSQELPFNEAEIMCTEHPDEKLKAYCSDHSTVCCLICVMLKHRKCENVGSIEDSAEQKKKAEEIVRFPDALNEVLTSLDAMAQITAENLQSFDSDIEMIESNIDILFTKLVDHLRRLKTVILMEVSTIQREIRPEIEDKHNEFKGKMSSIKSDLVIFHTNMKYAPPAQFLQSMEELTKKRVILEQFVKEEGKKLKEIRVTCGAIEKLIELEEGIQVFGEVNVRRRTLPSVVVSIPVEVAGIALLHNGQILLSSFQSRAIHLHDLRCSKVLSSLSLPGSPFAIKMTCDENGGVIVQNHGLVLFKIQNNQITKIHQIETKAAMHDFVYHQSKYYIGCHKNITVYDRNYRKVRDILVKNHVDFMVVRDHSSLCYTEWGGRGLFCITTDGTPKFTYSHLKLQGTTGITVDHAGYIYVCGHNSRNIHQISHDGKLQRIIFDYLPPRPFCVCFNKQGDTAVVGCSNKILLYDMREK